MTIQKEVLDWKDIQRMVGCGESVSRKIIREIRAYCGLSPLPKGKIFIGEWKAYANREITNGR